jgi:hypothetical protein
MGTPAPRDCELYYVDRDALFSYHKLSEAFLQRVSYLTIKVLNASALHCSAFHKSV